MPTAWRIVKAKHVATAFSGEGASKFGGRWNSRGITAVYASGSQSLAVLETLVHVHPAVRFRYKLYRLDFAEALVEVVSPDSLPSDWQCEPPGPQTKQFGDAWVRGARSAVLAVPSAILPDEWNFLLNPSHPDFPKIKIGAPVDFVFNPRLVK